MRDKSYQVLVCDDDEISLGVNQKYIELYAKKLKRSFECVSFMEYTKELEKMIQDNVFDLALLDIQFPNCTGIELAKKLQSINPTIPIIFITNYAEYKGIASDMIAVGYLEKPVFPEKLEILLKRAIGQIEQEESNENEFLEICVNRKSTLVKFKDISSIEIIQKKLIFNTEKGKLSCRDTMQAIEKKLPAYFLRISQSVIVNIYNVLQMDKNSVFMSSGDSFSIGRTFQERVREKYRSFIR